jgi:hypothetical protein
MAVDGQKDTQDCKQAQARRTQITLRQLGNRMHSPAQQSSLVMLPPVQVALGFVTAVGSSIVTVDRGTPSFSATTCATFVLMPWPLSMPWRGSCKPQVYSQRNEYQLKTVN